jgi:hypothetical protein
LARGLGHQALTLLETFVVVVLFAFPRGDVDFCRFVLQLQRDFHFVLFDAGLVAVASTVPHFRLALGL